MNTTTTLPISRWRLRYLGFIAIGLVVMGVLCNMIFYSEFGQGFSSLVYASIGLLLDLAKIAVIGLFVMFIIDFEKNIIEISICAAAWFVLSLLSFGAAYGFLAQVNEKYETERLQASNIYAQHENAVKVAQQKLESLIQYASVNPQTFESQQSTLQASLAQWEAKKARCPHNWYTKCINPAQAKIDSIQAQLLPIANQLDGYAAYQSASQHKQAAIEAFSKIDGSAAVQYHPLFINVGNITNSAPQTVKSIFILLTSFVVELLASVLFFLKARLVSLTYIYTPHQTPLGTVTEVELPPQPATAKSVQTLSIPPSAPNVDVYQQIVADIRSGELRNGSFRTLKAKYKLNQNEVAAIRNQLVANGIAVMNRRELVFL